MSNFFFINKLPFSQLSLNSLILKNNFKLSTFTKTLIGNSYYSQNHSLTSGNENIFNEWLGGLIDADGHFFESKKGYANFKIVVPEKDKSLLYEIKHKFGGSIKSISGSKAFKYKLDHKKGLIKLVHSINGKVRNPSKILQLNKVCRLYGIELKPNTPLTFYNG
jgi:hypothetical protein